MKKVTLLALALCLTVGTFAQSNFLKQTGKRGEFSAKNFPYKTANATISGVSMTESIVSTGDMGIGFSLSFDVTMNTDGYKFYYDVYRANALENFVDTSSVYSTMEEYLLAEANYYEESGYDYWEYQDGQGAWGGLYGDTEYEIYVLVVGTTDEDAAVITYTFTTPSSAMSGTPTLTINRVDNTSDGSIAWTTTPSDGLREFYFIAEPQSDALYWIENYPDYFESNEESYEYEIYYWVNGNYSRYFLFYRDSDVNDRFATDFVNNTEYIMGEDYVWIYIGINGNGEAGDIEYAEFTYGSPSSLNEVADLMNATIYPNPARDYVNISSKVNITKVELYNTLGQVVYSSNVNANTVNVPVSSLNNGTYFVKAYAEGMAVTKKIVVE